MVWRFVRQPNGDREAYEGTRLRAVIIRKQGKALPWYVYRMTPTGLSAESDDCFSVLIDAKVFCIDNAAAWEAEYHLDTI